jgi:hypothetical protein
MYSVSLFYVFPNDIILLYPVRFPPDMPEVSNDEILEFLVQKVEETGVSPSVTLTIGGLVVVGGLVRSKLYYDYLSSLFDTYTDKPEGGTREHGVIYDTKDPH